MSFFQEKQEKFNSERNKIYTHDVAAQIVELFENVLDNAGIVVPSPEDDQKEPDNDASLYGSTYLTLMDQVEDYLIELLDRTGATYVAGEFSGKY